jgi:hypothetical protein
MLRVPQHDWKIISEINPPPFVLSRLEGLQEDFSQTVSAPTHKQQAALILDSRSLNPRPSVRFQLLS